MKKVETKDRIKEALSIRNMKQSELVEKTGIDKGQMSSYLSGRYKPKQENLYLMAEALSVDEAWLMGYDVPMETPKENTQTEAPPKIVSFYQKLNSKGREIATEQVRLLTLDEKYTKPDNVISMVKEPEPDYLAPNAAHERTDKEFTEEERVEDDSMLD